MDLIDRQALCEYALNQKDKSVTPNDIMRFPSVQPEHRTGKWHDRRIIATNGNSLGIFRCSECKRASTITTAFCPNCGARMEGEQE